MLAQASMEMDREISLPESEEGDMDEAISVSEESLLSSSMADEPSPEEAKTSSAEEAVSAKGFITLKKWSPDESYLSNLKMLLIKMRMPFTSERKKIILIALLSI